MSNQPAKSKDSSGKDSSGNASPDIHMTITSEDLRSGVTAGVQAAAKVALDELFLQLVALSDKVDALTPDKREGSAPEDGTALAEKLAEVLRKVHGLEQGDAAVKGQLDTLIAKLNQLQQGRPDSGKELEPLRAAIVKSQETLDGLVKSQETVPALAEQAAKWAKETKLLKGDLASKHQELAEKLDALNPAIISVGAEAGKASSRLLQEVSGLRRAFDESLRGLAAQKADLAALIEKQAQDVAGTCTRAVKEVGAAVEKTVRSLADAQRRQEEQKQAESARQGAAFRRVVLGDELGQNDSIRDDCTALIEGVLAGEANACTLAGQLMQVHWAGQDRLPQLLKEVGEAYYKWKPKTDGAADPLEEALAGYLTRRSQEVNLRNRVDLVRPGARFNTNLHQSAENGTEVKEVFGWVVLRGDGKALYKATVGVK